MSKRIEELEEEKVMEEKDFNLKESSLGDFLNYIRILAKIEERKLAEKEFKEKVDNFRTNPKVKLIHNLDGLEIDFLISANELKKELGK